MNDSIGSIYAKRLSLICNLESKVRYGMFAPFFHDIIEEISDDEKIFFNTVFSRIAYIGTKLNLPSKVLFGLHSLRKKISQEIKFSDTDWHLGYWSLGKLIESAYGLKSLYPLTESIEKSFQSRTSSFSKFMKKKRVSLLSLEDNCSYAKGIDQDEPHQEIIIECGQVDLNEFFSQNLKALVKYDLLPMEIMLHNIKIDQKGHWHPQLFVFEPDYLVDVTSIAECFQPFGIFTESYLLRKYLPQPESKPLLLGIIANFFLDQLLLNPNYTFEELFPRTFSLKALSMSLLSDADVRDIMTLCKTHFDNLKQVVTEIFPQENINVEDIMIEPSFYSPSFGLQGRLDVLSVNLKNEISHIIELKSGKPFRPNAYGLSSSHFIQTLLYDIIIKNLNSINSIPTCYILYSTLKEKSLRHAPFVFSKLMEAMVVRNIIVIYEKMFSNDNLYSLLSNINIKRFNYLKGFSIANVNLFETNFVRLSSLDKSYLLEYSNFLALEQRHAKLGKELADLNGLSALWKNTTDQKMRSYNIINHLVFDHLDYSKQLIFWNKSDNTIQLSNFRVGDIVIMYEAEDGDILESHVLKGTITELSLSHVVVRLRSIPMSIKDFEQQRSWNLEHDLIDSQFTKMYRSLFEFVSGDKIKKSLFMGLEAPRLPIEEEINIKHEQLSPEQNKILEKIILSRDYFLLWGPPGTGKTSIILKYYTEYLLKNSQENILIIAFTNRAVDEICENIKNLDKCEFLRIGSRYSVAAEFQKNLLSTKMESISTRTDTRDLINKSRVITATVSSLLSVPQLFKLKKFDRVIVDEASQLLEPQLVGILLKFDHALLIGDHNQLPAVSLLQNKEVITQDKNLHGIGIHYLNNSLFERLYIRCKTKKWNHAYSMLTFQGRMHRDINEFPSKYFYGNQMKIFNTNEHLSDRLTKAWSHNYPKNDISQKALLRHRCIFYDTGDKIYDGTKKNNVIESNRVVELLRIYKRTILKEKNYSIGIITPYRAQIATINDILAKSKIDIKDLTVDTVERYQGSARDIIIISLCVNHPRQLRRLISKSQDGVDRKMNVALTRAREQVIMLGNKEILNASATYRDYIISYEKSWND